MIRNEVGWLEKTVREIRLHLLFGKGAARRAIHISIIFHAG